MVWVRAIRTGFDGKQIRQPTDKDPFEWHRPLASWMELAQPPPSQASASPSQPEAKAPSTSISVERLLDIYQEAAPDLSEDELTPTGMISKKALEKRLGADVPRGVFFNFTRAVAEQRRAAN